MQTENTQQDSIQTIQKPKKRNYKPYNRTNGKKIVNPEQREVEFKKSPLKIIPLGGLLEIGKNMTVFEYEDQIIIVDCGLAFPEDDMLGIDLVLSLIHI